MDMSLDDLLNMDVSTASKKAEKTVDAPGVVTVISREDIERFGVTTLYELLERLPGTMLMADNQFIRGNISFRGDVTSEVNNHVLLLMNGRPMRESTHGAQYTPIYATFPLAIIEKIEVVRGPGSVLYGTNAYAGVVNIITKGKDSQELAAKGRYGTFSTENLEANGSYGKKDYFVSGAYRYLKSKNEQHYVLQASDSTWQIDGPYNTGELQNGASLNAGYKGLQLNSFYSVHSSYKDAHPTVLSSGNQIKSKYLIADLGYEYAFTPQWSASANTTMNYLYLDQGMIESGTDYVFELTTFINPMKNLNVVLGGNAYYLTCWGKFIMPGMEFQHIPDYKEMRYTGYTQMDYRPIEKLKLILGGQINKAEDMDVDFVPRFGAIYNLTSEMGAKVLFGQAFRSPFATERTINIAIPGGIVGSKSLRPEKVTTLDVQFFYMAQRLQASATYFNSRQKDLISTVFDPVGGWLVFENTSKVSAQGIELEGKYAFQEKVYMNGSLVYTYRTDANDEQDKTLIPGIMAKIGVSYDAYPGVTVSLFNNGFSKPQSLKTKVSTVNIAHPEADVLSYLTANIGVDIAKMAKLKIQRKIQLNVYGTNLLNQKIYMENARKWDNTYPRQLSPAFFLDLSVGL
ncbi:MAG: TonB-dependent receptor [Chitinivibrionales bacterium]|nr:TonB-dependent receptor [Chitinivibrionales bacterium]